MTLDPFEQSVYDTVSGGHMLSAGSRVVVGYSGGADSTALLHCLLALRPQLDLVVIPGHFNHGLRGRESDAEAERAKVEAGRLGLSLIMGRAGEAPFGNVEEWARKSRYDFLAKAARAEGADRIAVGHHADDVAETVLLNLLRGAGPSGLSGIASARAVGVGAEVLLVRPLIRSWQSEILDYLGRKNISWLDDPSNRDPRFLRNRIRREVMPMLESINPGTRRGLVRTAEITRRDAELVRDLARRRLDEFGETRRGSVSVGLGALPKELPGLRLAVFREAMARVGGGLERIESVHLEAVDRLVVSGPLHGSLDLPGLLVRRDRETLRFERAGAEEPPGPPVEIELPIPGRVIWSGPGGVEHEITAEWVDEGEDADPGQAAFLDGELATLIVRGRCPGDRCRPHGMKGTRKLKDVMNELGVAPRDRARWPLFTNGSEILWVPGFRVCEAALPRSSRKIKISINPALKTGKGRRKCTE